MPAARGTHPRALHCVRHELGGGSSIPQEQVDESDRENSSSVRRGRGSELEFARLLPKMEPGFEIRSHLGLTNLARPQPLDDRACQMGRQKQRSITWHNAAHPIVTTLFTTPPVAISKALSRSYPRGKVPGSPRPSE